MSSVTDSLEVAPARHSTGAPSFQTTRLGFSARMLVSKPLFQNGAVTTAKSATVAADTRHIGMIKSIATSVLIGEYASIAVTAHYNSPSVR